MFFRNYFNIFGETWDPLTVQGSEMIFLYVMEKGYDLTVRRYFIHLKL